jgi:hypothetical protein
MSEEIKRNCISCKKSFLGRCEILKNNEEYQKLSEKREGDAFFDSEHRKHEFKENFICDNYKSMYIEYPIEVSKINRKTDSTGWRDSEIGKFVKIRPCSEEYGNKTFLGLYLGELPVGIHASHNSETKELNLSYDNNPAIFIFDLKKIIFGCASWWEIIETEEDLKGITDIDINNVWYVKALKALSGDA